MSTYAHVEDSIVVELFTPPDGVPIEECFHADLLWVDCSANPDVAPGWTATQIRGDWTFAPPPDPPPPSLPQQATALLSAPVTVVCTSLGALDADYPNNDAVRSQIAATQTKINAGRSLPGGGSTFNWTDVDGNAHQWPAAQFTDFADLMADFVYGCTQVQQGHSTTLPSTTLTIP